MSAPSRETPADAGAPAKEHARAPFLAERRSRSSRDAAPLETSSLQGSSVALVRAWATALPARLSALLRRVYPPDERSASRWAVPVSAAVIHALHAATVYIGPVTLLSPMRREMKLSVVQISLPLNVFRAMNAVFLAPVGALLDRWGAQRPLRVSILCAAALSFALPLCTRLWQLVLLQAIFAVTKLFGGITALLMISASYFPGGVGMATAASVLLSGYSAAGFIAPVVLGTLTDRHGWRVALATLCVLFSVIAVPLVLLYGRQNPSSPRADPRGNRYTRAAADGEGASGSDREGELAAAAPPAAREEARLPLFTADYCALIFVVASFSASMHIVLDHLLVYLSEDAHMALEHAAWYMSMLNLVALLTKLTLGPLGDRFDKGVLMSIFGLVATAGSLLIFSLSPPNLGALTTSPVHIGAFCVVYGVGYAAVFNLTTGALPDFGQHQLGLRSNVNLMVLFTAGSLGSYVASVVRTRTGSYRWPFVLNSAANSLVILGGLLFSWTYRRRRQTERDARADAAQDCSAGGKSLAPPGASSALSVSNKAPPSKPRFR